MIQAKGTILSSDGVTEYANPLINVYFNSSSKFQPTIGAAQVGKIVSQDENKSFNIVAQIATYQYNGQNPTFEQVQAIVLAGLQQDYPTVIFEIVL
jgi:hypothetical protein